MATPVGGRKWARLADRSGAEVVDRVVFLYNEDDIVMVLVGAFRRKKIEFKGVAVTALGPLTSAVPTTAATPNGDRMRWKDEQDEEKKRSCSKNATDRYGSDNDIAVDKQESRCHFLQQCRRLPSWQRGFFVIGQNVGLFLCFVQRRLDGNTQWVAAYCEARVSWSDRAFRPSDDVGQLWDPRALRCLRSCRYTAAWFCRPAIPIETVFHL